MASLEPGLKYIYQNHILDSTRWNGYTPRDDDIIIATTHRSGTTWMQAIVLHMIFQDLKVREINDFSPWLEFRPARPEARISILDAQTHRRVIKTHLPLDGLPYFPQVKYIMVGRDVRDVGVSLWNHYTSFKSTFYDAVNDTEGRVGPPLPQPQNTFHQFWRDLMSKGWFDWESEGYPFWTVVRYVQTWWDFKHLDNILLVHFNDLLENLEGEIRLIAHYLNIDLTEDLLSRIAHAVTFKTMKQNSHRIVPGVKKVFHGGTKTFINKGTNGRWHNVMTENDLERYHAAIKRELSEACAKWLEFGRLPNQ